MDSELLVDLREDGLRVLEQLSRDGFPVSLAIWIKPREDASWRLLIATPLVDGPWSPEPYRRLVASMDKVSPCSVTLVDLSLENSSNPLVVAAIEIRDRLPRDSGFNFKSKYLGTAFIHEGYIYPEINPLRLSYIISYAQIGDGPEWASTTHGKMLLAGVQVSGAVSYSSVNSTGDPAAVPRNANVGVLVAIDPKFRDQDILDDPVLRSMTDRQAQQLADAMFLSHHPDAIIKHDLNAVTC